MKPFSLAAAALLTSVLATHASAAPLRILYLSNDAPAFAQTAFNQITGSDSRFDHAGSVVRGNGYATTLAELNGYDVVWVGANYDPLDTALLATYVDGGGKLVASTFIGHKATAGKVSTDLLARLPVISPNTSIYDPQSLDTATSNMSHPIMNGVTAFGMEQFSGDFLDVRPGATAVARFKSGRPLVALSADQKVAYVSALGQAPEYGVDYSGDFHRVFANTLAHVGNPVPEPASMAVLGLGLAALKRRRRK